MLCRGGIALAGLYPLVHVCFGRTVFSVGGEFEKTASALAAYRGSGADHGAGADLWTVSQPQLPGMGLPKDAAEFSWADLSAFYAAVDSSESDRHGAV